MSLHLGTLPPAANAAACPQLAKADGASWPIRVIRVSDARMSGTAFGTIVLHVTPDAASGGPLALVRNGDRIALSVKGRRIDLKVEDAELKRRAAALPPAPGKPARGYARLYAQEILGADGGCDFAFLRPVARQNATG